MMKFWRTAGFAALIIASPAAMAAAAKAAKPSAPVPPAIAAPPAIATPLQIEPAAIDEALGRMVESRKVVGVSALVYQGNREVYFGAFGMADRENNKPMTRDTVVPIFSMTKPVTGV